MEHIPTLFEQEAKRMSALNKHKHMNSNDKSVAAAFLAVIGVFALVAILWLYGIFAYGYVAVKLWAWFVVPVFHTAITFGIIQAAGLFMFVRFFTTEHKMPVTDPDETMAQKVTKILVPILTPWATLFFGWLLHSLFM